MLLSVLLLSVLPACSSLPDIHLGVCGNHVVDSGEECDSADPAACGQPATADACHWKCSAVPACPAGAGDVCNAVTQYCRTTPGVCGNLVVDPDEDCDGDGPSCGAPGDAKRACRRLCTMGPCASGSFCGRDGICRQPTGTYTLGPPVASPESSISALDVDGDGWPDLVERGLSTLAIRTNDQHGGFVAFGEGPVHLLRPPMALQSGSTHLNPPSTASR